MGPQASVASRSTGRRFAPLLAILVIGGVIALLAYGLTTTSPDDTIDENLAHNRSSPAPDFDLELLEPGRSPARLERKLAEAGADGRLGIQELRGSPVVLNFWASWCAPCAHEARMLEQGWKRWAPRGVAFLGLDMQDLRGDARSFLRRYGVDYPTVRDPGKKVARGYGATGIPETYFISPKGRVVAHVVGVVSSKQLSAGVAGARTGRLLGTRQGGARRPPR
jgi:cytochrome c biogenesis protein CcmG/thiol:disulfide interchange protein DsbE